jgi:hypothetical protein
LAAQQRYQLPKPDGEEGAHAVRRAGLVWCLDGFLSFAPNNDLFIPCGNEKMSVFSIFPIVKDLLNF